MNLHEYQAKQLFARYGLPAPVGYACTTPREAEEAASKIGAGPWVVKCQVHAGGRGKAGGVKVVNSKEDIRAFAENWLGKRLVTYQTDANGQPVNQILVEAATDIAKELYLGAVVDRSSRRVVFMASTEGGVEIEKVAEETCLEHFGEADLEYVIGTEVPVPGGAHETLSELAVTTPDAARATLEAHRHAFEKQGLNAIWPRIIALVVQPGVEFDHTNVIDYQPAKATALSQMVENYETLIFEAHSTDYQTPQSLRQLVIDHFAILKVGPALTFALREALFSLAAIEEELVPAKACSGLRQVLENVMLDRPEYWQSHYHGDGNARRLARGYSYSDRVRYYWPDSQIDDAFAHLIRNLADSPIPLPLISQYLPLQYVKVRSGELQPTPRELIINHIQDILAQYHTACEGQ